MIKIESSRKDERYSSSAVLVNITHCLNKSHIADIIKQAKEIHGEEFILELLGYDSPETPKYGEYMVSIDGATAPSYTHRNQREAVAEAKRILQKNAVPRTARVLLVVKTLRSRSVVIDGDE